MEGLHGGHRVLRLKADEVFGAAHLDMLDAMPDPVASAFVGSGIGLAGRADGVKHQAHRLVADAMGANLQA